MSIQKEITEAFANFRPAQATPPMPFHSDGRTIEELFFDEWIMENNPGFPNILYIPVYWTRLMSQEDEPKGLQTLLNLLPQGKHYRYFTVCHNDVGVKNVLPKNTLVFCPSGKTYYGTSILTPYVWVSYKLPSPREEKDRPVLASFIGSDTHYSRVFLECMAKENPEILVHLKHWGRDVGPMERSLHLLALEMSKFTLCPQGYIPQSFRFYEALQFGSVPVVISADDSDYLPNFPTNYGQVALYYRPKDIPNLAAVLRYHLAGWEALRNNGKELYEKWLNPEGLYKFITSKAIEYANSQDKRSPN